MQIKCLLLSFCLAGGISENVMSVGVLSKYFPSRVCLIYFLPLFELVLFSSEILTTIVFSSSDGFFFSSLCYICRLSPETTLLNYINGKHIDGSGTKSR